MKRPFVITKESTPTSFRWTAKWRRSPRNFLIYMILKHQGGVDRDMPDGTWYVTLKWDKRNSRIFPGLLFREA